MANNGFRIALTGGPGGGKTTAADLFRRELGPRVVVVPEAATLLFGGGFPRYGETHARRAAQSAIYHVQKNLEDVQRAEYPKQVLLCDRGTVDGAVYWPDTPEDFFEAMDSSLDRELDRYDAVVFFQSAAVGGADIKSANPVRVESEAEAAQLDARLHSVWSQHPRFHMVPHATSFMAKINAGLEMLQSLVAEFDGG